MYTRVTSGLEDFNHSDYILPANGAFVHKFATASASAHVATLQHDTVHRVVHADLAQFVVIHLILAFF